MRIIRKLQENSRQGIFFPPEVDPPLAESKTKKENKVKKVIIPVLVLLLACGHAFAAVGADAEREAHRKEMKVIKDAQRVAHQNQPKVDKNKAPGFWDKEAERSGFSRVGNPGGFLKNLNPMPFFKSQDEQFRARKAAAGTK